MIPLGPTWKPWDWALLAAAPNPPKGPCVWKAWAPALAAEAPKPLGPKFCWWALALARALEDPNWGFLWRINHKGEYKEKESYVVGSLVQEKTGLLIFNSHFLLIGTIIILACPPVPIHIDVAVLVTRGGGGGGQASQSTFLLPPWVARHAPFQARPLMKMYAVWPEILINWERQTIRQPASQFVTLTRISTRALRTSYYRILTNRDRQLKSWWLGNCDRHPRNMVWFMNNVTNESS